MLVVLVRYRLKFLFCCGGARTVFVNVVRDWFREIHISIFLGTLTYSTVPKICIFHRKIYLKVASFFSFYENGNIYFVDCLGGNYWHCVEVVQLLCVQLGCDLKCIISIAFLLNATLNIWRSYVLTVVFCSKVPLSTEIHCLYFSGTVFVVQSI